MLNRCSFTALVFPYQLYVSYQKTVFGRKFYVVRSKNVVLCTEILQMQYLYSIKAKFHYDI